MDLPPRDPLTPDEIDFIEALLARGPGETEQVGQTPEEAPPKVLSGALREGHVAPTGYGE